MEKTAKKRGRPAIEPYIELIIMEEVDANQRKPQEERLPLVVLAGLTHDKLKGRIKVGSHLPTRSTVEKRVQRYAKTVSTEDDQWSISTLDKHPIPPESMPKVLAAYKRANGQLTIREAKWIARLSATDCHELTPYVIARSELLHERLARPREFEGFDRHLAGLPHKADTWQAHLEAMASRAGILKDDPTTKKRRVHNERISKAEEQE